MEHRTVGRSTPSDPPRGGGIFWGLGLHPQYAGYRSVSTLRKAARAGTLRTVTLGPRAIMTTHDWLNDDELAVYGKGGHPRGEVRPSPSR